MRYTWPMTLLPHQQAAIQKIASNGALYIGAGTGHAGMGKSNLMMQAATQILNQGGKVVWLNGETLDPSQTNKTPPLPHNPDHTPLQCLAEGVRRVGVRTGGRVDSISILFFSRRI